MFVLKNGHAQELRGANCHAKLSHSKQLLKKYLSSDVSTILLTDEKIFTVVTLKKPKKSPTLRNCSNQEERCRDKTLVHTVSVLSVNH